jgi:uncharacterized protein
MPTDTEGTSPVFDVTHESAPADTLLVGLSNPGLAGLTAVDYLTEHLDMTETGHVSVDQFPAITPFEAGTPRHHTRLFADAAVELTTLVGELYVPSFAAGPFGDAVFDWIASHDVEEVVVLAGVPVPHGPEEHRTFYVATEDYQRRRLGGVDLPPMGTGFLDGVNAELLSRGLDSPLAVGVLVTPVHARTPDVEAAIRLLDAVQRIYGVSIDTGPLEEFAAEVEQHYRDLAERIAAAEEPSRDTGDRMYM